MNTVHFWHIFWCASISWNHVGHLVIHYVMFQDFVTYPLRETEIETETETETDKMAKFSKYPIFLISEEKKWFKF